MKGIAVFGQGCFWCTEAIYQRLKGVEQVESGYTGGLKPNPSYEQVCSGASGHVEVSRITFDLNQISYEQLLSVFWQTHDPTSLNKQGADVGTQYRSAIFYLDEAQRELAEAAKNRLDETGAYPQPIVTTISPLIAFYKAEDYHQNYYNQHGSQPYCSMVIKPKLEKFQKAFGEVLPIQLR